MTDNIDELLRQISSHELSGRVGYHESPIGEYEQDQISEEISKLLRECRIEVETADSIAEPLIPFGKVAESLYESEIETDEDLPVPDTMIEGIVVYTQLFDIRSYVAHC